jgi:TolB-like protein/Tfp pilus assembly protein PilF
VRWRAGAAALALVALAAGGIVALMPHPPADAPVSVAASAPPPAPQDHWRSPTPDGATRRERMLNSIVPIAILPFGVLGDTGASAQLTADMMTDDLINVMSRTPAFRVISRRTTSRYQGVDVATIGAELQVKYVLEGSIRTQDGGLRVNLQLVDPATRLPLWSGRVERADADRHAVRDEIVAGIARQLQIEIIPIEGERRSADQTADADAYLGWSAMQSGYTQTGIDHYRRAEAHFRKALERDPQHVSARVGIAAFHANLGAQRLDAEPLEHLRKAREILGEVVQHHPDNASALFQLAIATQSTPGPGMIKQALPLFERAVALNPSNAGAHAHIGHALARTGEPAKGIEHIRYAMRLSPKDPSLAIWHEFIGNAQLELAQYADASESFRISAALAPDYPRPWAGLVAAHALAGNSEATKAPLGKLKALAHDTSAEKLLARFGRNPRSRLHAGLRVALLGATDQPQTPASDAGRWPNGVIPIVILPFTTLGENPAATPSLADMVTDDLTNMLSRVQSFRVISRHTALSYKDQPADVAAIGAELHVRYVLEGSLRAEGDRLRVNVELNDPATRLPAWTARIERDRADRVGIVDAIVTQLARELQFEVIGIESARRSNDPDADALIYRGWAAMYDIGLDSYRKAEGYFGAALARDPDNLSAQIGMGAFHARIGALLLDSEPLAHRAKAQEILQQALRRDPQSSTANFYLGLALNFGATIPQAVEYFKRSIELNPSFPSAHAHLGLHLARTGHPAEGLEQIRHAMRLSPRDPTMTVFLDMAGYAELELDRAADAVESFRRAVALKPAYPRPWAGLAAAHALAGRLDEARDSARKLVALQPSLTTAALLKQFGRGEHSRLHEGLRSALDRTMDGWRSPTQRAGTKPGRSGALQKGVIPIVILPFAAAGTDGATQLIADMMTDDLSNALSRAPVFRVISRQTARSYAGAHPDPETLHKELNVGYALTATVTAHDGALDVAVELVDTVRAQGVWSARFSRSGTDRLLLQDEIIIGLGRELSVEVTRAEGARATADPDVSALIFRGWSALFDTGAAGLPALAEAQTHFAEALQRDPGNARASIGLAAYHVLMAIQLYAADPAPHLAQAESILQPILTRNPTASDAAHFMGVLSLARRRIDDARQWFERAIEQNPSEAQAYAQLGRILAGRGHAAEGLEHVHYAMRLSPRDPSMAYWLGFAGAAELELGHDAKAIDYLGRALALHPTQPRNLLVLVAAHAMAGNRIEAREALTRIQQALPHLTNEKLIEKFFGAKVAGWPRLREGLRRASVPEADSWQSPPLPSRHERAEIGKPATALAVLPFTTYGESAGAVQQTADILTEDLTNSLSRVAMLRVISRQTMRGYLGQKIDTAAVGAELGVSYVIEGNVRTRGDKLRVNVELIDPATRLPVWSTRIERDGTDLDQLHDEIVGRLARELHFEVYRAEVQRGAADPGFKELIYQGWTAILSHGTEGLEALKRAEAAFLAADVREPGNPASRFGLGAYHTLVGSLQLLPDWRGHLAKAEHLLRQNITEAPEVAGQHFYLSIVLRMRGELEPALELLQRCIELAPSTAPCHAHLGHTLVQMNRADEGLAHINYALRLSPRDQSRPHWLRFAGEAELEMRHFDRATALLRQSYAVNPRHPSLLRSLAAASALSGDMDESRKYIAELGTVAPHLSIERYLHRPAPMQAAQPELNRGLRMAVAPKI